MPKSFNVTGVCVPKLHYMVPMRDRIDTIVMDYVEKGGFIDETTFNF